MNYQNVFNVVGKLLLIFSGVLLVPAFVGVYYQESLQQVSSYVLASFVSLMIGVVLENYTKLEDLQTVEGMAATVTAWVSAILIGSIPLLLHASVMDAVFETTAGFTTTGITLLTAPEALPQSVIFWRSIIQWLGGLGILTFFLAIIRHSGGVSRRLFTAESHKTSTGSIRPSLTKSLETMVKVYMVLSALIVAVYVGLGMSLFESVVHAFSGISTGGFSTHADSIAYFGSNTITLFTALVMFLGGANFVLLFEAAHGRVKEVIRNTEFRVYALIILLATIPFFTELREIGQSQTDALVNALFQSASIVSTTGFSTVEIATLSVFIQSLVIVLMITGGSVGSTSGGFKVFRILAMAKQARCSIKKYSLPRNAINKPVIDGEIIGRDTLRTIFTLFFIWISIITLISLGTIWAEDVTFIEAVSAAASTTGNVGPVFMGVEDMAAMEQSTKILWMLGMLAGRLEMIPLLVLFNRQVVEETNRRILR